MAKRNKRPEQTAAVPLESITLFLRGKETKLYLRFSALTLNEMTKANREEARRVRESLVDAGYPAEELQRQKDGDSYESDEQYIARLKDLAGDFSGELMTQIEMSAVALRGMIYPPDHDYTIEEIMAGINLSNQDEILKVISRVRDMSGANESEKPENPTRGRSIGPNSKPGIESTSGSTSANSGTPPQPN